MVRVRGKRLSADDRLFIGYAANYTLDYMLPKKEHEKSSICIALSANPAHKFAKGTCEYRKSKGRRHCDIGLDARVNLRYTKNMLARFEQVLPCLMHEVVHAKQHLCGELVDIAPLQYRYRGHIFTRPGLFDPDGYFNQPFEVEAFGHEVHLVGRLQAHWKKLVINSKSGWQRTVRQLEMERRGPPKRRPPTNEEVLGKWLDGCAEFTTSICL